MPRTIDGVKVTELDQHKDDRGWLMELFRHDEIEAADYPVMSYISMTLPGVARGPHEHVDQTDLFYFAGPSTFRLYLWDNREESATYGQQMTIEGGQQKPIGVIVPPGVVHGYKNVGSDHGLVFNAPNRLYRGTGKADEVDEIRHEDDPESKFKMPE